MGTAIRWMDAAGSTAEQAILCAGAGPAVAFTFEHLHSSVRGTIKQFTALHGHHAHMPILFVMLSDSQLKVEKTKSKHCSHVAAELSGLPLMKQTLCIYAIINASSISRCRNNYQLLPTHPSRVNCMIAFVNLKGYYLQNPCLAFRHTAISQNTSHNSCL
eukprot:scaffold50309_cov26-Prasinocladus_malaysianus.AAC.1